MLYNFLLKLLASFNSYLKSALPAKTKPFTIGILAFKNKSLAFSHTFFNHAYLACSCKRANRTDDYPPLLCLFGKFSLNCNIISFELPYTLANNAELPSITINPYVGSSYTIKAFKDAKWN